jgi:hypothetical protein
MTARIRLAAVASTLGQLEVSKNSGFISSFSVLKGILDDPKLAARPGARDLHDTTGEYLSVFLELQGNCIKSHANAWHVSTSTATDVEMTVKELTYLAVILYGVGGWDVRQGFRADFFL